MVARTVTRSEGTDHHHARCRNKNALHALLEKRSDLNLAGKVRDISILKGHGGYSDIFTGIYLPANGTERKVAVKKIRAHIMEDDKLQKSLAKELYVWSKLRHTRILPLEGFYIENDSYPYLISEWMDNGTILPYLKTHPGVDVLSLIVGIAEGIQYLHSKKIVHSDIKPDNVLISNQGEPLLCDFGVSRMLASSETFSLSTRTAGVYGTIRFMSREILQPNDEELPPYSKESDVWAFGMTVFNILTMESPYHNIVIDVRVMMAIINGLLPSWPEETRTWPLQKQVLRRMCELCWKERVTRPSMDDLLMELLHFRGIFKYHPNISHYKFHYMDGEGCSCPIDLSMEKNRDATPSSSSSQLPDRPESPTGSTSSQSIAESDELSSSQTGTRDCSRATSSRESICTPMDTPLHTDSNNSNIDRGNRRTFRIPNLLSSRHQLADPSLATPFVVPARADGPRLFTIPRLDRVEISTSVESEVYFMTTAQLASIYGLEQIFRVYERQPHETE